LNYVNGYNENCFLEKVWAFVAFIYGLKKLDVCVSLSGRYHLSLLQGDNFAILVYKSNTLNASNHERLRF
jgi:hypothetical protein